MILKEILDFQGNPGLQKGPSCDMSANTKKQKIEGFQGTPQQDLSTYNLSGDRATVRAGPCLYENEVCVNHDLGSLCWGLPNIQTRSCCLSC